MVGRVRRGSIVRYLAGSQRLRVVVVTADRYNPGHALLAPLRERVAPDLMPAFLVPLNRRDWSVPAVIDLSRMRAFDPQSVDAPAGQLTAETLRALTTAMRAYFGLVD
jgi:PemK-like, MazF-like toxin of type II toxin-antitoxin system